MSTHKVGRIGELVLADFSQLQTDRYGMSGAAAHWTFAGPGGMRAQWGSVREVIPSNFSNHPVFDFLQLDRKTVRWDGSLWHIEADFYGIDGDETEPVYELQVDADAEPIETHPKFNEFAGTSTSPKNGAKFDSDGVFLGFTNTTLADWCGVQSYVRAGAIWSVTYCSRMRPTDINRVGRIDEPDGWQPSIATSKNWLYIGMTFSQRGSTYQVRKTWKASGTRGWNTTLYG